MILYIFLLVIFSLTNVQGLGKTSFECPDGFHLSDFSGIFVKNQPERVYKFGCTPLGKYQIEHENCQLSRPAMTSDGDIYLTCNDNQYTVGISILEDMKNQIWNLLCCQSPQIKIREKSCVSTRFLNEYHRDLNFSSRSRIVRKLQSIHNNTYSDRKWWLQLCMVKVSNPKIKNTLVRDRFSRSAPDLFGHGLRFYSAARFNPLPMSSHVGISQLQSIPNENGVNFMPKIKILPHNLNPAKKFSNRVDSAVTISKKVDSAEKFDSWRQVSNNIRSSTVEPEKDFKKTPQNHDEYYDYYSTEEEKEKPVENGLIGGIQKLLSNVQDGLSLAEFVLPLEDNNVKEKQIIRKPTFSLNVDSQPLIHENEQKVVPNSGAIQNMLQFLGLCNPNNN